MTRTITIQRSKRAKKTQRFYDDIFQNIQWSSAHFASHGEIAGALRGRHPHTITILIEHLDTAFWNNAAYVKKTRVEIPSSYHERLFRYFFDEFGERGGNDQYARWLDQYRPRRKQKNMKMSLDDFIIERVLAPRYAARFPRGKSALEKLKAPRFRIERERYYRLPDPLSWIDWRTSFDTLFVWEDGVLRRAVRGGSGSSGARETNSMFIYGYALLNQKKPVPTYLFLYTKTNELIHIASFRSLTVPARDLGSNYHIPQKEEEKVLGSVHFIRWKIFEQEISSVRIAGSPYQSVKSDFH